MSQENQPNPMSTEEMQKTLDRLRVKLRDYQDSMDITAFAIKAIERDLQNTLQEDIEANENA